MSVDLVGSLNIFVAGYRISLYRSEYVLYVEEDHAARLNLLVFSVIDNILNSDDHLLFAVLYVCLGDVILVDCE